MTYQQWNTRRGGMSNGGAVHGGDNALTMDDLARHVPSMFATEAHESRSERFVPIPSQSVVTRLMSDGFQPFFAQQAKTRLPGKQAFTKHVVRMRHPDHVNADGVAFEVIMTNANDGTSSWRILPGFFRFVCMNGLFMGDAFPSTTVRHTGGIETVSGKVLEAAHDAISVASSATGMIERMRDVRLDSQAADIFASSVHRLRFPDAWEAPEDGAPVTLQAHRAPVQPMELLDARRIEDGQNDLWTIYNVAQENVIRGGQRGLIRGSNGRARRATVRSVNGITQAETLNREIATRAERMLSFLEGESA